MKNLYKIFCFIFINCTCFCAMADYPEKLQKMLSENRINFSADAVSDTLRTAFSDVEKYNIQLAADTYDMLAGKNAGSMSVEDLFVVCLKAYKDVNYVKNNSQIQLWAKCKESFILPLLNTAEQEAFIDNYVVEIYDGTKFNEQCTPSETDVNGLTPNMICSSGKYSFDPAFQKAMDTKFRTEGGCTNSQGDGCHRTCYGVCSGNMVNGEYKVYYPKLENDYKNNTHNFTRQDAEDIGYRLYKNNNLDKLPDAIRGDVFMALWGTGQPRKSIGLLQQILGVPQTNKVDDATVEAAKNYKDGNLRKKFLKSRWKGLNANSKFSRGWAKAFIVYMQNGCHSITKLPLERNAQTIAECKRRQ